MLQAAGSLVAIAVLIAAGVVMTRRGWLGDRAVDGLKALITQLTLPLLLFRAFLQLAPRVATPCWRSRCSRRAP